MNKKIFTLALGVLTTISFVSCDKIKTLNEPEFEKDILGDLSKNIYLKLHGGNQKLLEIKDKNTVILKSSVIFFIYEDYDKYADKFEYKIDRISPNKDTLYLKNDKTSIKIYYNGKKDEVIYESQKEKSPPYQFFRLQNKYLSDSTEEQKEF